MTLKSLSLAALASVVAAQFSEQYTEYIRHLEEEFGNGNGEFTEREFLRMLKDEAPDASQSWYRDMVEQYNIDLLFDYWSHDIFFPRYDDDSDDQLRLHNMADIVRNELHLVVDESEITRLFDTYAGKNYVLTRQQFNWFTRAWQQGQFVFDGEFKYPFVCPDLFNPNAPESYSRRYSHLQAYHGLAFGDHDGELTLAEMTDLMTERHPEQDWTWMEEAYTQPDCYKSFWDDPEFAVDNLILKEFSSDGQGLTSEELTHYFSQALAIRETNSAVEHIMQVYSSDDDYITRWDLVRFYQEFMYADDVITDQSPWAVPDAWPHHGEIAKAISAGDESAFAKNGRPVDIGELVVNLLKVDGPDTSVILRDYAYDYKWWNDFEFVTQHVVGRFVDPATDLYASGLTDLLEFVGVGPFDDEVIELAIEKYSEVDGDYLTYNEQNRLIEDWFTVELQFTQLEDKLTQVKHLEQMKQAILAQIEVLQTTLDKY